MSILFQARFAQLTDENIKNRAYAKLEETKKLLLTNNIQLPKIDSSFIKIDFDSETFDETLCLDEFVFPFTVTFHNCIFKKGASFNNSIFTAGCTFSNAKFSGESRFVMCKFHHGPNFRYASFDRLLFSSSKFFGQPDFRHVKFEGHTTFSISKFADFANFSNSVFYKSVQFDYCEFLKNVTFTETQFHGTSSFRQAENVHFLTFEGAEFLNHPPTFSDGEKLELMEWRGNKWPNDPPKNSFAESHAESYERLGFAMSKIKRTHSQQNFKRLELKARRVKEKNLPTKATYIIFEGLSDYGFSYSRALFWWALNIIIGAIIITFINGHGFARPSLNTVKNFFMNTSEAIALSFANSHSFLGMHKGSLEGLYESATQANYFNLVWAIQSILGFIFVFFVGLTLTNKFRSK